jgi:major membrane immunogen (membrane-anchored lipoprotein)
MKSTNEDLSRIGQEAFQRLIDKVEECDAEVCLEVVEGAGHSVAAIGCYLDPVIGTAVRLLADVVMLTYRAGCMHGKADMIRESN